MDGQRFDGLVRKLATGASRRSTLKAVAGGAVAAALGLGVAGSSVSAADKKIGQKCDSRRDCPPNAKCKQTTADGGKRCCRGFGGGCVGDRDCCRDKVCVTEAGGGTCR